MKYFGCIFLFLGITLFSSEHLRKIKRKSELYSHLLSFLEHVEKALSSSVIAPSRAVLGFKSDVLTECGFLTALGEGKSIPIAFESVSVLSYLSGEDKKKLSDLFGRLISSDYRDMRLRVSMAKEEMQSLSLKENEEMEKTKKIVPALTAAFAVGFAILVI